MSNLRGNPHYEVLAKGYTVEDPESAAIVQTEALLADTYATETANLLTFYNTHSLYESLDDADRLAIYKEILQRIGVKDA